MKRTAFVALAMLCSASAHAQTAPQPASSATDQTQPRTPNTSGTSGELQKKVAPGLAKYTDEVLFGRIWPGDGLSPRDRSLAVISALIATNKPSQLRGHLGRALQNGVTAQEASGVLTHLALYTGWPNAVSALDIYDSVYTERGINFAALQADLPPLPAESAQVLQTQLEQLEIDAPKFAQLTSEVIVGDLWRRSDLTVRDRSLVTIATLTATGDSDLLEPYLRLGVETGLTRDEIIEAVTHLGFYAGWTKATKALTVVSATLGSSTGR